MRTGGRLRIVHGPPTPALAGPDGNGEGDPRAKRVRRTRDTGVVIVSDTMFTLGAASVIRGRRVVQIVAFAVLGILLVALGGYWYQASVAGAQWHNSHCPPGATCTTAEPLSLLLYIEDLGWILILVAVLLTTLTLWSMWRTRPVHG
jgi:hypothetical protein